MVTPWFSTFHLAGGTWDAICFFDVGREENARGNLYNEYLSAVARFCTKTPFARIGRRKTCGLCQGEIVFAIGSHGLKMSGVIE